MESASADVLTGRMLDGRYVVRSRIAHGGMATVYLATDTRLDREVALKVMHADLARDADFVDRFIGEAKSVAKLSHPNIVGVYDQGADGEYLYLVMEYVPGRTLRALLRERGWLPWPEALSVLDPVLCGLAAAHQAGIAHRDVKPENVLITADGRVKVVDFGLARTSAAVGNTRAGTIMGSVAYIAPEQVTGARTDARTDVYSAGIMLFEMLTGRQPFSGETPLAVAYAHVNSDVPAVGTLVGGIPPSVDNLVRAATSRDPQLRPPDADVFMRAARSLRGIPDAAESSTGVWAAPTSADGASYSGTAPYPGIGPYAVPGQYPGTDDAADAGLSHTMVVSPGYEDGAGYGGGAGAGAYDGAPPGRFAGTRHDGGREPFLQRWLFSRRLVYLLVALAVLIGLGGGAWWLASGRYTPVPAVTNMTAAAAEQALRQAGFQAQTGSSVVNDTVPKGDVVAVSPSGRAQRGATIVLTLSQGPKMVTMPQIPSTDTAAQAEAALRAAGLTATPVTKPVGIPSPPVNLGTVAGTVPAAGTSWPDNKPVTLETVAGLTLPDLSNMSLGQAQALAAADDFTLVPTQASSTTVAQNNVISQSPVKGTVLTQGQTVTVQVSSGPPGVTIPSVQGESCQQAYQQLQQLGFNVSVNEEFFHRSQAAGTSPSGQAQAGSAVTLTCGSYT
jgi:serine/threonine-protein kinase